MNLFKRFLEALRRERRDDPLLAASGMIDGLPSDLSERVDEYLLLTEHRAPTPPDSRDEREGPTLP